jgi:hypothetical protein
VRDVRRYWQEVRAIQAGLPESVWLASTEGGSPVQVPAAQAALLLHAKAHRIADDAEVCAHLTAEEARDFGVRREQLRRRGVAVVKPLPS